MIKHIVISLEQVMGHFAKEFKPNVRVTEWLCDTAKGRVIFVLWVDDEHNEKPQEDLEAN